MNINVYLNSLRLKGFLSYTYSPFHNYQTNVDLYKINDFIIPAGLAINPSNGELLNKEYVGADEIKWVDKHGNYIEDVIAPEYYGDNALKYLYARAGSLIDLDTDKLNFDLDHPVDIEILPSYDGSVNLILNDGKNIPRLINSRFSVREKNTYEIVDRIGENDTNIYNSDTFDKDTSLYFQYNYNPIVDYKGFVNGVLPVGTYCFYFVYCDSDNNESDIVAETGVIPVFNGTDNDPRSIDGGIKNQTTNKGIQLKLSDIDKSYNYFKVYYVRYFADYNQTKVCECKKIILKYLIDSNVIYLQITGNEQIEDVDPNVLNISRFNPKNILTQTQCKNMLFFGNVVKHTDNYQELTDCALRIIPKIKIQNFSNINNNYTANSGLNGYYSSYNMYNSTGYLDHEFYRFGVVFIYNNGTLSNVYNTLGGVITTNLNIKCNVNLYEQVNDAFLKRTYISKDNDGWIASDAFQGSSLLNSKGVCKLDANITDDNSIIGITFNVPENVTLYLRENLGIRGLFFVRQKRIPSVIALCYLLPLDKKLEAPVIECNEGKFTECFIEQNEENRAVSHDYNKRLYKYADDTNISKNAYVAICPDFLLNQPYYNQIFNGSDFKILEIANQPLVKSNRLYYEGGINSDIKYNSSNSYKIVTICSVTEDVPTVALRELAFRLTMGAAEEAYRFRYANADLNAILQQSSNGFNPYVLTNLVRGKYSPYLAIYSNTPLNTSSIYNIYSHATLSTQLEFLNRMNSNEPFYAISNRYNFFNLASEITCFRGDCYLNTFTFRLNRNFNDPTLPNNDLIIKPSTWKDDYKAPDAEKDKGPEDKDWQFNKIYRSDVNAVLLGSWITIKVRSSINYALRSQDHSWVSEEAEMGTPRTYYPRAQLMYLGTYKMPDSYLYNDAYRTTLGFKCYFTLLDMNYIKDTFSNRILYSSMAIQDSYKNNYRESLSTYFRDYSTEYGSITKLVGFEGYILVIFEHAIGLAVINERILAGLGDGNPVFINTLNVLPEELTIITDTYGTLWGESVVKSEAGFVYGVDTVAKKIWRVKQQLLEIISDFKVNKFLIDNITLGERENHPIIGVKNVKSHYNNNKKDIMFTFYNDNNSWNLCFNELIDEFITFYSWIPSYSENIDTQFFTFNRDTSKYLTLLGKHNYNINDNIGVLLESPVMLKKPAMYYQGKTVPAKAFTYLHYRELEVTKIVENFNDEVVETVIKEIPNVKFRLELDNFNNYKMFEITGKVLLADYLKLQEFLENKKVALLEITPYTDTITYSTLTIVVTIPEILETFTNDFYLHGQAGNFDIKENVYPTRWYDEQHPFEFEFVVNDKIGLLKIFNNLILISNKAEPESFHFEVEGDNYEFSSDKRAMYFRLESTKELFASMGSNIKYNSKYPDVAADLYTKEQYYRNKHTKYPQELPNLVQQVKSSIFPLYYKNIDDYNEVYYNRVGTAYDFKNLSGSEIVWNRDLNLFDVVTHIKNSPIDLVGRLRGNSRYKEGKWHIQIPTIIFNQRNENTWPDSSKFGYKVPPLVINTLSLPEDLTTDTITLDCLPNIYHGNLKEYIDLSKWTYRKEARIRDKWIKIRIRYSGKNLAVIHSLITLYNISFS